MKQLFSHTTTLLRTVLLFGALSFVNTQSKAQTQLAELLEKMPSAFKYFTADEVNGIIDDGNYYYIQFYNQNLAADLSYSQNVAVFLADCGNGENLRTKDYLPFSDYLQWKFVRSGDGFKLQSKNGTYVQLNGNNRYIGSSESNASVLKIYPRNNGGYEIGLAANDNKGINRVSGAAWAELCNWDRNDNNNLLRVAELKPNVAHIIYYREEGVDNNNYAPTTTRHYLTYSGSNPVGQRTAIENGNMEGNSTNSFSFAQPGSEIHNATITDFDGSSRGIRITSAGNSNNEWDTQFFITANEVIPINTTFHLEFDYRASTSTNGVHVQAHAAPSANSYIAYNVPLPEGGNMSLNFTTEWKHFSQDITVTQGMGTGDNNHVNEFQSLVFDLWKNNGSIDFYFDNIVFTVGGVSVINNGSLEGTNTNNFFSKVYGFNNNQPQAATITDRVGCSRGISIYSANDEAQDHNTQFFIRAKESVPIGTTIHLEFDYRATRNATVPVQAHGVPGAYHYDQIVPGVRTLAFTTEWQHYSQDITITNQMGGGGNDFQTIAFNLGRNGNNNSGEVTYFFDNVIFNVPITHDVSSRRSIVPNDMSLWSLPTAAAYHQDGLWSLIESGDDGTFYIKKFGTEEYMNSGATGLSDMGTKDASLGEYKLEDPAANRYTRIQNMKYETSSLTANMFHWWNGYESNAQQTGQQANVDFQLGTILSDGGTVAGSGNVNYLLYADLTGYTKIVFEGTPGVQVRVLLNRQTSNTGPITERTLTIDNDGKGELDLTDLEYVHLNAIKIGWGNTGEIGVVTLVKEDSGIPSSPNYLNYNTGDGSPVYQINNDADHDWYAGFYPVEVSVPNKDEFFQVIVKVNNNGQMLNHAGGTSTYTEEIDTRELWILEQVDDYLHYRLKDPKTARYVIGVNSMTNPNEPNNAEINTNAKFWTDFTIKWFLTGPLPKENLVDYYIKHKTSYLKQFSDAYQLLNLNEQGLVSNTDSEWWNFDSETQKVNHFEITHYVKFGQTIKVTLPTVLNRQNDHITYQRWYHYNDETCNNELYPDGSDIEGLKSHVSLDSRDDGDVQYYIYKNGLVTGSELNWDNVQNVGLRRYALRTFNFTNSDGNAFTVAADVSRYSEFTYRNETSPLEGDLEEPSLTMRYLFFMKDAKDMATNLTACTYGSNKWLEEKTFHFPAKQVAYDKNKWAGYRGEFIGLRHLFSDYWVFDGKGTGDENLVSAVDNANGGKIEVVIDDQGTGIKLGGYNPEINLKGTVDGDDNDYQGFYFFDLMKSTPVRSYGDSRFIVFRYPSSGEIPAAAIGKEAYINVYLNNNGTRYQLAQFTIIFDEGTETLPWVSVNGSGQVKDTKRDPGQLFDKAGKPIAKITFDFPTGSAYTYPDRGITIHNNGQRIDPNDPDFTGTIPESGPIPLTFDKTNYSFDGSNDASPCTWGAYALIKDMTTTWGNRKRVLPANVIDDYGYGDANPAKKSLQADEGFQNAFLYIDASEQPGDICSAPFMGDFCSGDKLMFSGWISGANAYDDDGRSEYRCPGGVTLTVKGEHMVNGKLETETLYRFCPGQCYELDNGTGVDGSSGDDANRVIWQQFYFEFTVTDKYDRHWLEVNNNCVSSNGGDFMLDNIEVYAIVPEVKVEMNTTYCVEKDGTVDMRLLKIMVDYNKEKSSLGVNDVEPTNYDIGFVFLKKDIFLNTFKEKLSALSEAQLRPIVDVQALATLFGLDEFSWDAISLDDLAYAIKEGYFEGILGDQVHQSYIDAFDAAFLGNSTIWRANAPMTNMGAGVMYFQWNSNYDSMEEYSFAKAINKTNSAYRYTDEEGEKWIVMNGNYPQLPWEANVDYYIVPSNELITGFSHVYGAFNICSPCTKTDVFRLDPPYELIGLEYSEDSNDYMVCEGQIPTLLTDLKGYDFNGVEVPMNDINYDWWLGDPSYTETVTDDDDNTTTIRPKLPTLVNYHAQAKNGVKLDVALSTLRIYYPEITSLDGIIPQAANTETNKPAFTQNMIDYLKELVDAGELVLHQKSISVPAKPASADDPYFYMVACPIHDEQYDQALNPKSVNIVNNGSMEGSDASSFFTRHNNINSVATITNGVGKNASRGISFTSAGAPSGNQANWDSQFFIRANEVIPEGTTFHLEFDYKASEAATVSTQAHSEPGSYIDDRMLGNMSFTTEWQHFEADIPVTSRMANGPNNDKHNSFQTIAFNLWTTQEARTYYFDNVELTIPKNQYVAFFCDEPQGLRIKLGQKAPTLQTGFVPGEHGFTTYNYNFPANTNPVLSIRLAKAAQFETVKNTEAEPDGGAVSQTVNYLWLPIRNAQTESASGVIQISDDNNIYLAASNDLTWDKKISTEMNKNGLPPVVGRIVQLYAINTKDNSENPSTEAINTAAQNNYNRLAIYFKKDFNVREGYNYTLSLPFQENEPDSEKRNACNGTILINLKIVPDYEVWTGAAGNIDWNNDENWRRADGNTDQTIINNANNKGVYSDELYRANGAKDNPNSPLYTYTTNKDNYYSSATSKTRPGQLAKETKPSSDQVLRKGFAPLYCTHVLMKSDEWGNAPELYDGLDAETEANNYMLKDAPFPNLRETSTPILKFDMQARKRSLWKETYGSDPDRGSDERPNDLIAEMYQINSCDEIAFQPGTELRNAHLLNYNSAWMEYQLDNKRWYLLGSPLQGTISGEWYAPKTTAQQKTTYYDPVAFRPRYIRVTNPKPTDNPAQNGWFTLSGQTYSATTDAEVDSSKDYYYYYEPSTYDRYNPAIYQRSWDKAKAVLYEVGSTYDINDDSQTQNLGSNAEGYWSTSGSWNVEGADEYLGRLGYKPMGGNKANVAIKGMWSNTYNDAQVDYATGGFSVMVMNHLKGTENDKSGNKSIIRLPKEDTMYDYYEFSQTNANDGGTDTELSLIQTDPKNRALNRGRLKADKLLPELLDGGDNKMIQRTEKTVSRYGDMREYTRIPIKQDTLIAMNNTFASTVGDGGVETPPTAGFFTETIPAGVSPNLGFFLVENPFPCGLDMAKFFNANSDILEAKYWLLTEAEEGQNPRQVLVQQAPDGEWITSDGENAGTAIEYPDPNPVVSDDPNEPTTDPEPLKFYPHAVLAPGQGFFVQAKSSTSGDLTVTFNKDMQAQSRFGMIQGEGTTYTIVVGQSQKMRPLKKLIEIDTDDDGIPDTTIEDENSTEYETIDVDLNGNGIYGETYTEEGENGEQVTIVEKETVMVPVYETDDDGNKIPVLEDIEEDVIIYKYVPETLKLANNSTVDKEYPLLSRRTRSTDVSPMHGLVITAKRGADESSALVMKRESASDDFLPSEDTETFIIGGELQSPAVPTVYTLCGRLATAINSIHDFTCLPLGVESNSDAPCTLTFNGVELLGDSVAFYDAVERKLTPLESGMKFTVSGQTQNRYYLVSSLNEEEVAEETHLQIFTEGRTARVIASTAEPITDVRCFDPAGRLVHSASPQTMEYSFTLPDDGIYIIEAQTEKDRKTKKVAVK